jgi:hypothetical protein
MSPTVLTRSGTFAALVLASATAASQPGPADFARTLALHLEPGGSIYRVELPRQVYAGLHRPDLGDLRVFNGRDEVVPHALAWPEPLPAPEPAPREVPLFPLTDPGPAAPATTLRIRIGSGGTLIETGAPPADAPVQAWLLDLSQFSRDTLVALQLEWGPAPAAGFLARIGLAGSDDLLHWEDIGTGTLADLTFAGEQLRRDTLRPRRWPAYIRLAWPAALRQLPLHQARVLAARSPPRPPARQEERLTGQPGPAPGQYRFEATAPLPADRVQVFLPQANTLVHARLAARVTDTAPWHTLFRGPLYDLEVDGTRLRNEPVAIRPAVRRYWQLDVAPGGGGLGAGQPVLELAWVPHELLFLARGEGPFRLAFGSARAGPAADTPLLRQFAAQPGHTRQARIGAVADLAGATALTPPPHPLPWSRIGLWAVLLLCVAVLAWMARRVYRQLSEPPPQDGMP